MLDRQMSDLRAAILQPASMRDLYNNMQLTVDRRHVGTFKCMRKN